MVRKMQANSKKKIINKMKIENNKKHRERKRIRNRRKMQSKLTLHRSPTLLSSTSPISSKPNKCHRRPTTSQAYRTTHKQLLRSPRRTQLGLPPPNLSPTMDRSESQRSWSSRWRRVGTLTTTRTWTRWPRA